MAGPLYCARYNPPVTEVCLAPSLLLAILGVAVGAIIGAAAMLSNFCALGALADILFARDWRRIRAWMLAAGTAIVGAQVLQACHLIDLDTAAGGAAPWVGELLGGLLFGYGMALSGGCINRALVRLGAGSLKSLVILLTVAATAAATLHGLLSPLAAALQAFDLPLPATWPALLAAVSGVSPTAARWAVGLGLGGGLMIFALKDRWFRQSPSQVLAGLVIGAMIPAAWAITAQIGTSGQEAINFAAPTGDLLVLAMNRGLFGFALAVVVGVPVGAFIAALASGNLALETFTDRADLPRNLAGAALMGFGGVLALGCTFGQGLSGVSALTIGSVLAVAAMAFGCLWGIRAFEAGSVWGGLKLTFSLLGRKRA